MPSRLKLNNCREIPIAPGSGRGCEGLATRIGKPYSNRGRCSGCTRLGWWLFGIWNFCVVLPGWVLVCAGFGQPLEWAEFPLIVAGFVVLGFVLAIVKFVTQFIKKRLSG